MRRSICAVVLLAAASAATPAHAAWLNTRWGMSLQELKSLFGSSLIQPTPDDQKYKPYGYIQGKTEMVGRYDAEGYTFKVYFFFDGGLKAISLIHDSKSYLGHLASRVADIYGPAINSRSSGGSCPTEFRSFRDPANGNLVRTHHMDCGSSVGSIFTITYEAASTPGRPF